MSNEIYSEYVVKYWVEAKTQKQRIRLNQKYTFGAGDRSITGNYSDQKKEAGAFLEVRTGELNLFKRAPKTQMINGHKVVAPRYDMPEHRKDIIVMNCFSENGIEVINFSAKTMKAITNWGWFSTDNEDYAIAYANAHRESK